MPCQELFDQQDKAYRKAVLGSAPRISVEAAAKFGWERYVGEDGLILGMDGFGASGPADRLYEAFGLTPALVAKRIKEHLSRSFL
jgi:transketolase